MEQALNSAPKVYCEDCGRLGVVNHANGLKSLDCGCTDCRGAYKRPVRGRNRGGELLLQAEVDGRTIGKAHTYERSIEQLHSMGSRRVTFRNAVAVVRRERSVARARLAPVRMHFRSLADERIQRYPRVLQTCDCAGSAKREGLRITLPQAIDSDHSTAWVGLPLVRTCEPLRAAGTDPIGRQLLAALPRKLLES